MAYAALISLKLTLEQILLNPDRHSFSYENQHFESLIGKLGFLQEFLEKYSSHKSNEAVACLERRIRDAAYQAQDFTDLHQAHLFKSLNFSSLRAKKIDHFRALAAALENDVADQQGHEKEMALLRVKRLLLKLENDDFKNILQETDSIVEEATKIKEQMGFEILQELKHWDPLRAGSSKLGSSSNNPMVGFEDYIVKIKYQLNGEPNKLEVISIVGMGGIGKTTLATSIYTDTFIRRRFEIRAWATVSQSYCKRDIMLSILGSMKSLSYETHQKSDDQLGLHLYQALKNRRYLIIIDDIWDTNAWDQVKMSFPDDNNQSRIMLTTRLHEVAAYAGCSEPYQMSLLSDDQSWILLEKKVFGEESCPPHLEEIGKMIAQNCRGLPLSILVIGGLLSRENMTQEAWQNVAGNVTSLVTSSADQCLEILKLSYDHLPQHLKACFLYMGVFPEDYEIMVSKLTKLWVAEGFLKQADQSQSLEEVAERRLEELIDRSLILLSKRNPEGRIKTCKIHDLLHDFCVRESNKESFLHVTKWYVNALPNSLHIQWQRRISIHPMRVPVHVLFNSTPSMLFARSFLLMGKHDLPSNLFLKFKLLRVLDAVLVEFLQFPSEVLELLNLRYIAFKYKGVIPASISKLRNLQTLIIHQVYIPFERKVEAHLPVEIWSMPHLRHVQFSQIHYLDPAGAPLGNDSVLRDLQTLSGLINLRFTDDMLARIPNIQSLEISYDPRSWKKGMPYYLLENLVHLQKLKELKISVFQFFPNMELKFSFPHKLKKLSLSGCKIPWHDMSIVGSIPELEVLKLTDHACQGEEWEPNEEEFCQLKLLVLKDLDLKRWKADNEHFQSLECLILRNCNNLVEIPSSMGESSTLKTIKLDNSSESALTSAQEILKMQQSLGNEYFQVINSMLSNVYFNGSAMKEKHWDLLGFK